MEALRYTCSMNEATGLQDCATVRELKACTKEIVTELTYQILDDKGRVPKKGEGKPQIIYNAADLNKKKLDRFISCGWNPIYKYKSPNGDYYVTTLVLDYKYDKKIVDGYDEVGLW